MLAGRFGVIAAKYACEPSDVVGADPFIIVLEPKLNSAEFDTFTIGLKFADRSRENICCPWSLWTAIFIDRSPYARGGHTCKQGFETLTSFYKHVETAHPPKLNPRPKKLK